MYLPDVLQSCPRQGDFRRRGSGRANFEEYRSTRPRLPHHHRSRRADFGAQTRGAVAFLARQTVCRRAATHQYERRPRAGICPDGIAEDVITALSRYPSLFVIARNSSFTYKGRAVDVRQIGRDLGVRYVLEGSLRKSGKRIRVTVQLVEAETGKHVWAERYDRHLADIFAVQDEITVAVMIATAPAIAAAELQRAMRKPPGNLDA